LNNVYQWRKLTGMVGADFENSHLMRPIQIQDCERHADLIIKTSLAPKNRQFLPEHRCYKFFGGGFPIRTSDPDDWYGKLFPVSSPQLTQGLAGIRNGYHRRFKRDWGNAVTLGHYRCDRFSGDFLNKLMTIESFTREGEKDIPWLSVPRIRANSLHRSGATAGQ
jgi:hypothetical protein